MTRKLKQLQRRGRPKFKRYDGSGQFGLQIARKKDWSAVDHQQPNTLCYRQRRDGRRSEYAIRIASDEQSKPIWAIVSIVEHREIPDDMGVVWAYLLRRRRGKDLRWSLMLTINSRITISDADIDTSRWVAIRPGYSEQNDGFRSAVAIGYDGQTYQLTQNKIDYIENVERDEQLQRDLSEAVAVAQQSHPSLRRTGAPHKFARARRDNPDNERLAKAVARVLRCHHNLVRFRERIAGRTKDAALVWIARLHERYDVVLLPDTDYSRSHKQDITNPYRDAAATNRQKSACAPGMLRTLAEQAWGETHTLRVSPESHLCHQCGSEVDNLDGIALCRGGCRDAQYDLNAVRQLAASGGAVLQSRGVLAITSPLREKQEKAAETTTKKLEAMRQKKAEQVAARKMAKKTNENKGKK